MAVPPLTYTLVLGSMLILGWVLIGWVGVFLSEFVLDGCVMQMIGRLEEKGS